MLRLKLNLQGLSAEVLIDPELICLDTLDLWKEASLSLQDAIEYMMNDPSGESHEDSRHSEQLAAQEGPRPSTNFFGG